MGQQEQSIDSSLAMLEQMTQRRADSPPKRTDHSSRSTRSKRLQSRSRSVRRKDNRRGLSHSRSISVHKELSPSRKKRDQEKAFKDALEQRMKQREGNDTTRRNIVQENYNPHKSSRAQAFNLLTQGKMTRQ